LEDKANYFSISMGNSV